MLITVATTPPAESLPRRLPALRDHRHELIAIDDLPLLIHDHDTIRVAIERNTDIGAEFLHFAHEQFGAVDPHLSLMF